MDPFHAQLAVLVKNQPPPQVPPTELTELMRGRLSLTPVTLVLVAANVAVFAAMVARGAGVWHFSSGIPLAWGASFGPATEDGQWWRLVTAMFVHFGLFHLAINMWALWDAGRLVERLYGGLRFAALYFSSGLAGNLLSLVVHGDHAVSGGASGAIFGLLGALLVCLWRERRAIHPHDFRWFFFGAAAFAAVSIALGMILTGIDNAAHLGGLASGTLLGTALARPLSLESPSPRRERRLAAGAFLLVIAALAAAIPAPAYRWREEQQARAEIRAFLDEDRRIGERWQNILESGGREGLSFDELAGRIDSDVTREYEKSFDQLSAVTVTPAAPSATMLETLKKYAQLRGEAAHSLAEGLRKNDREQIREALKAAQQAPYAARGATPPPAP